MLHRIWNALKFWTRKEADQSGAQRRHFNATPLAIAAGDLPDPKSKAPNKPGHATAAQRLAMLQSAAHNRNSGPPAAKMRDFERARGAQWRIKRYTRAK